MKNLRTCIIVLEKILIIISVLSFIPTSLMVFGPKNYIFSKTEIDTYNDVLNFSTECKSYITQLGKNIQNRLTDTMQMYNMYKSSSRFLWYSTLPILAMVVGLMIINVLTSQLNVRREFMMGWLCLNINLLALIIKSLNYYSEILAFKSMFHRLSLCNVNQNYKNFLSGMANIDFGVGYTWVMFMGIVGLLIFLATAIECISKIIQFKHGIYLLATDEEQKFVYRQKQTSLLDMQLTNYKTSRTEKIVNGNLKNNERVTNDNKKNGVR